MRPGCWIKKKTTRASATSACRAFRKTKIEDRIYAVTERSCVSRSNSVTATNDSDKINDRLRAFFSFYSLSGIRSDASRDLEVRMNLLEKYGDKH